VLNDFIHLMEALQGSLFSAPIFILLYAVACFVAPISLFPVAGGVLFGLGWGLAINLFAVLLGASGAFAISQRLARGWWEPRIQRWAQGRPFLLALEDPTPIAFILIRLLGFPPFVVTNYLAGLSKMRWRRFLWTSAIGLLPWTFLMTFFAVTFWKIILDAGMSGFQRSLMNHLQPLLWGAGVLVTIMAMTLMARRWLPKKTAGGN